MKKQCDHLAIASSSLSLAASESDPEDSFWRDFDFDFSFLTSDEQKTGLDDDIDSLSNPARRPDSNSVPKAEESELYGLAVVSNSNVEERSPPQAPVLGVSRTSPVAKEKESPFSPLFTALRIKERELDETEVGSPCWKGTRKSLSFRRSRDDLNLLYGLNPMAPQFIPSNVKNGKEFEENGSSSLKRSLSSTFPPSSSGEFSIVNEAGIEQGYNNADESLDITNQFQRPTKLDPLAPVFVPSYALVHEKSIATEKVAHSTYEVGYIGTSSNPTYSSNPRLQMSPLSPLNGSKKRLNPLAPQFSLAETTKPKVYGSVENQAATLFSPVDTKQMGLNGTSPPQMDVKKLLTTIHGLSELLIHVHGSPNEQHLDLINSTVQNLNSYINNGAQEHTGLTSLPNMCKQSIREHQIPKARNLSASVDFKRKEKYSMVLGGTVAEPQVEYGVTKENGFGQVVRNHRTGEQINPQVLFYKSLWLKARADSSLMEYETYLSNSRT